MQRIILYIVLVGAVFWGFHQIRDVWESNQKSLDATYAQLKESAVNLYATASVSTSDLKDKLNAKIKEASDKYDQLQKDIEATTSAIQEKKDQLDTTLKDMQAAKAALDKLLEQDKKEPQTSASVSGQVSTQSQ